MIERLLRHYLSIMLDKDNKTLHEIISFKEASDGYVYIDYEYKNKQGGYKHLAHDDKCKVTLLNLIAFVHDTL